MNNNDNHDDDYSDDVGFVWW